MSDVEEWSFPEDLQPDTDDVSFDLDSALIDTTRGRGLSDEDRLGGSHTPHSLDEGAVDLPRSLPARPARGTTMPPVVGAERDGRHGEHAERDGDRRVVAVRAAGEVEA